MSVMDRIISPKNQTVPGDFPCTSETNGLGSNHVAILDVADDPSVRCCRGGLFTSLHRDSDAFVVSGPTPTLSSIVQDAHR